MRALAFLGFASALTLAPSAARAGGFAEAVGGVMIPVADDDWTNYVESGPKLGARVGSYSDKVGGMLMLDWSPLNTDNQGWSGFGSSVDVSSNRFRILGAATTRMPVGKNLTANARFGAGVDITHVTVETNIFGNISKTSDTDAGIALEFGGGLWFKARTVEIGVELGIPLSFHSDDPDDEIDLADYSSFDIDILFGVRFSAAD